jgi:hypothetical protein
VVFENFDKDIFDHVFIFSDHGFKFSYQTLIEPDVYFLNKDRVNIFLFHRFKGDKNLALNNKLCSIQDLIHTVNDIMGEKNKFSLFSASSRDYVVVEDHLSVLPPEVNQNVDIWAIITKDLTYVRTLKTAAIINNDGQVKDGIVSKYDDILIKKSQYGRYLDEYNKVFSYNNLILAQTTYMNGSARREMNFLYKVLNNIDVIKDCSVQYMKKIKQYLF